MRTLVAFLFVGLCSGNTIIQEAPIQNMFNVTFWNEWKPQKTHNAWSTRNRTIYHNNEPLIVRGVNFNGFESPCRAPLGLSVKPLSFFLDFLQEQGFNAIRIPIPYEIMADENAVIGDCGQIDNIPGKRVSTLIDFIMDESFKRGIYTMFDLHTIGGVITPMPWTDRVNENMVVDAWLSFLTRFYKHPGLMGIEIKNEPHDTITLSIFFTHCAKVITNIEQNIPDYDGLYFISGIQNGGPWGGSFENQSLGFKDLQYPSILCAVETDSTRFVFNPHVYGTSVRGDAVITEGPAVWEERYGFITSLANHWNQSAIIPTEIGGFMTGKDKDYYYRWVDWHVKEKGLMGGFWWTIGPYSDDTGGLFDANFSINWEKVELMKRLAPSQTHGNFPPL